MSSFHNFLGPATQTAVTELISALARLPEDRRDWSPGSTVRTATDQFAECVATNNYVARLIESCTEVPFESYEAEKANAARVGGAEPGLLLMASADAVVSAIQTIPDAELSTALETATGEQSLSEIAGVPY
ncbi:MAG: hypothetical protein H7145_05650 [Akkermansiaceae bacterium]|nr:hypothetical protein [Armatimonadota bacterium]